MTEKTDNASTSGRSLGQAVGAALRFLLRLFFVLVIGVLIGASLYYGVPWLYRRLVWPVQENSARIVLLQEQVDKNSENIFDNQRALEQRIVVLEGKTSDLQESVAAQAENQGALERDRQQLAEQVTALEEDIEACQEEVERDRSMFAEATSNLEGDIRSIQDELEVTQQELAEQLELSAHAVTDLEGRLDDAVGRVALLRAAQTLLKVRLLLVEENPGAARDTLGLAIAYLDQASGLMPSQAALLGDLSDRMMGVDDLIASGSFRARPTLESLWADLMDAVPLTARSVVTETQGNSPLATPTRSP